MKIFIDESWDIGFKEASSEYFCFALVVFDTDDKIERFREMMGLLRKKLHIKEWYEFHYSHMPRRTKKEFCDHIVLCDFEFYGLIIQKRLLVSNSIKDKKRFYNYTASLIINNANGRLWENADFYIDGSGDRNFRQEISNYLKFKFNDYGKKKIKKIRMVRSESFDEIQLADFLAGCMRRSHEWISDDVSFMQAFWKQKQKIQIWPE